MKLQALFLLLYLSIDLFCIDEDQNIYQINFYDLSQAEREALPIFLANKNFLNGFQAQVMTKSELKQIQKQAIVQDIVYHQKFGQGYNATENMMNKNNDDFVNQLISGQHGYCDEQILALWSEYNARGKVKKKNRQECEKRINKELRYRQKLQLAKIQALKDMDEKLRCEKIARVAALKTQAEQDALLKKKNEVAQVRLVAQKEILKKRMKQLGLDPGQCAYLPQDFELLQQEYESCGQLCHEMLEHDQSDIWKHRAKAAQQTVEHDCSQSWYEVTLSPQAQGYLAAQGLPADLYRTCYGTALQQQLHAEVCTLFESVAQAQLGACQKSIFLNMAAQCGDASFWSNQFEAPSLAMGLVDLGAACCKMGLWAIEHGPVYLQAMRDGVVESAWDFVHMVSHPREMVENIGKAAWFVFDTIALTDEDAMGATLSIARQQRQERFDTIHEAMIAMKDGITNSTGSQQAKMVTKFAVDCLFQHKALQVIGAVAGIVRANAGTLKTMEYVAEIMSHESEFAFASESIIQATQDIESVVQKSLQQELVQLSESIPVQSLGEVVEQSVQVARSFDEVINEVARYGKIPLNNPELCAEVKAVVTKIVDDANVAIDVKFRQKFGSKWTMDGGMKKRVNMDLDHALNYEVKFKNNKVTGSLEIKLSGGHLAGCTEALAEKGLIKIIDKQQLSTGCWKYDCADIFTGEKFTKTEFHVSWDKEMIIQKSWDLFENPAIAVISLRDGKMGKIAKMVEKELTIVIKNHEKDINIVTILPYIEELN